MLRNEDRHGEAEQVHGIADREKNWAASTYHASDVYPFWSPSACVLEVPFDGILSFKMNSTFRAKANNYELRIENNQDDSSLFTDNAC